MEMDRSGALLEVEGLHVRYKTKSAEVYALNGLDLRVERGEKLGLVGETGAGKTTLALSILRLLPERVGEITAGSIRYEGEQLLEQSEAYMLGLRGRRISMIFQDPMTSLNPIKTVGEQILEVLDLHFPGLSKAEKLGRVARMLETVGIPASRGGDFPYQFSGGMKQRIVIAMALIGEPELLLRHSNRCVGSTVGTDCRLGAGSAWRVDGDTLYVKFAKSGQTKKLLKDYAPIVKIGA